MPRRVSAKMLADYSIKDSLMKLLSASHIAASIIMMVAFFSFSFFFPPSF